MTCPDMEIVWSVLRKAVKAEDFEVIEACRRLAIANRLGWKQFTTATDWNIIFAFDGDAATNEERELA